ncbi:hypothetical protein F5880DRAFT_1616279 [Lentinula raphanica]|nr:hypothetical protein F5880DRAFT_1616279 [Lentinula raphanica]
MLALVASSFPKLESLFVKLSSHAKMYDMGDVVSVFTHFYTISADSSALNHETTVGFSHRLSLERSRDGLDCDESISRAASGILHFASLLAKQVRSMDFFFFVEDMDHVDEAGPSLSGQRYFIGLLAVRNGNRDVDATFQLSRVPTLPPPLFFPKNVRSR